MEVFMDNFCSYSEEKYITNIKKVYPNMITIKIYNEPLHIKSHRIKTGKRIARDDFEPDERSLRRSHQLVSDYVLANEFELFCTFTFDPKKFKDRNKITACSFRMNQWFQGQRAKHSPGLKYLAVPEYHADGKAIHFHALISHFNGTLRDSGHIHNKKPVYNLTGWRWGFSTAQIIPKEDIPVVSRYVRKYITKQSIKDFGSHRFLHSRNLIKPEKSYNVPDFKNCLPFGRKLLYEREGYSVYELDPAFYQKVQKFAQNRIDDLQKRHYT